MRRTCNVHFLRNIVYEMQRKRMGKSLNGVMRNVYQRLLRWVIYISIHVYMWRGTKHGGIVCVMLFTGRAAVFLEFLYFADICF
jgi:hypothetical protein